MWLLTPVMILGMISLIQNWEVTHQYGAAWVGGAVPVQSMERGGAPCQLDTTDSYHALTHCSYACNSFFVIIYVLVRMVVWSAV